MNNIKDEIDKDKLLVNIDKLHTTPLGVERILRNLSLDNQTDVVKWCKQKTQETGALIKRQGKNYYIQVEGCVITVNAHCFTIITAHKLKGK